MATFEDFFVVGSTDNSSGFSSYISEVNGKTTLLGIFEKNNTVAIREELFGTKIKILMVGGGGSGSYSAGSNPGAGGSGGGHLLIEGTAGSNCLNLNQYYDIKIGKGGENYTGYNTTLQGNNTSFGYLSYENNNYPVVSGGRGANYLDYISKDGGTIINDGTNIGFSYLIGGNGGKGGKSADASNNFIGFNGETATYISDTVITNHNFGEINTPGHYWIGGYDNRLNFGTLQVGGGGGGGGGGNSGGVEIFGKGGNGGNGYRGGIGGIRVEDISSSNAFKGSFTVMELIDGNRITIAGCGGGGGGIQSGAGESKGGIGSNGILMIWFDKPNSIINNVSYRYVNPYYNLSFSNKSLFLNTYKQITYPDTSIVDYFTSFIIGEDSVDLSFNVNAETNTTTKIRSDILLVGGGGGGGGGIRKFVKLNSNDTLVIKTSGGGGGGGIFYGHSSIGYNETNQLVIGETYNVNIGKGGKGGNDSNGEDGKSTTFGNSVWQTIVSGGEGGKISVDGNTNSIGGNAGDVSHNGILTPIIKGRGGNGGNGSSSTSFTTSINGSNGTEADFYYNQQNNNNIKVENNNVSLNHFENIVVSGGGGGGGGFNISSVEYFGNSNVAIVGGNYGFSGRGYGGNGGYSGTIQKNSNNLLVNGENGKNILTEQMIMAGGGGGGGGISSLPFKDIFDDEITNIYGGNGGDGIFMIQVSILIKPGIPLLTPIPYNPFINVENLDDTCISYNYKETFNDTSSRDWYLTVFQGNNSVSFNSLLDKYDVNILLIGGGGGGSGGKYLSNTEAYSGSGGGSGGHLLINKPKRNNLFNSHDDISYSIIVGTGGVGRLGLSGEDGGDTIFGSNIFGEENAPYVSGGKGGFEISGGDYGIVINDVSNYFTILNGNNTGIGGKGGSNSKKNTLFYGESGSASSKPDSKYGNNEYFGSYYLGPYNGDYFGSVIVGGGGGGGGGGIDLSLNEDNVFYGEGGNVSIFGEGGEKGLNTVNTRLLSYSKGENANKYLFIGNSLIDTTNNQKISPLSIFGGGGGGGGMPFITQNSTGGDGSDGAIIMWFGIPVSATFVTPYYSISVVNTKIITVSNEQIFHDGSKTLYYTTVVSGGIESNIKFLTDASGQEAQLLLVGGGGGGGGGTNENYTYSGGGGGGGGHIFGSGSIGIADVSFITDISYEIELGQGGIAGYGANQGSDGGDSYFGRNVSGFSYTQVTGGGGGRGESYPGGQGIAGDISSSGVLSVICGGNGGNGGEGGAGDPNANPPIVSSGINGNNSTVGNTDISGLYIIDGYGAIGVCGGGGGGGGIRSQSFKLKDISGEGGYAGFGLGGKGGISPYYGTKYYGDSAISDVMLGHSIGGGGGGGGGVPYDGDNTFNKASEGGTGGDGLFMVHMEIDTPAPIPPDTSQNYINEFFAFDISNDDLYVEHLDPSAACPLCGGVPGLHYIAVTKSNNKVRFFEAAKNLQVDFILIGAGGQGGGGINSVVKHAGQGGGGGGIAYGMGIVGTTDIPVDISYDIVLGYNTNLGGHGKHPGYDGSGSSFGENYWNPGSFMKVSGGQGGGVLENRGEGGTVIYSGPFIETLGGTGGNGGRQQINGNGINGGNAVTTTSGLSGKFIIPSYGFVIGGGGGGGGAGISGEDVSGSGGINGRGSGGLGGLINGYPFDASNAETIVSASLAIGGGGGGGGGMPTFEQGTSQGGDGGNGIFVMFLYQDQDCNPYNEICGCEPYDGLCGCGKRSKCPEPVEYKQLVTGGNDPKFNPAIALALHIRGSLGRPGYQRFNIGNRQINEFGSYAGAPGGSRAPPKNKF